MREKTCEQDNMFAVESKGGDLMKFIWTKDGYVNMDYVKRLFVEDTLIMVEDVGGRNYVHDDDFDCSEAAQDWLDDLIKELEKDAGV